MQETVLKINLESIRKNALGFKALAKNRFLYAVVKADAYGHGDISVVNALSMVADGFAVALISEALSIKQAAGGKEILVFTPPMDDADVVIAANNGFTLTATDIRSAKLIADCAQKYGVTVNVQIKVNTGMNRYGIYGSTLGKVCSILKRSGQVRIQGVYSHLYSHDKTLCEEQRLRFLSGVKICRRYFPLARAHLASTFGTALGDEYLFDGVRIGLGLYGYFPDEKSPVRLFPAMQAMATCVASRKCLFGGVGYGEQQAQLYGKNISVLRVGYAEGVGVIPSQSGLLPPFVGRFCMDVGIVEGTRKVGAQECLFTGVEALALEKNTSVYETLCLLALRANRVYVNE